LLFVILAGGASLPKPMKRTVSAIRTRPAAAVSGRREWFGAREH